MKNYIVHDDTHPHIQHIIRRANAEIFGKKLGFLEKEHKPINALKFLEEQKKLLEMTPQQQEYEIYTQWSEAKFMHMLELLFASLLQKNILPVLDELDVILSPFEFSKNKVYGETQEYCEASKLWDPLFLDYHNILFEKGVKYFFEEYIFPNAAIHHMSEDISAEERKYIANLIHDPTRLSGLKDEKAQGSKSSRDSSQSDIFNKRKRELEFHFILVFLFGKKGETSTEKHMLDILDQRIQQEKYTGTDKEYGSLVSILLTMFLRKALPRVGYKSPLGYTYYHDYIIPVFTLFMRTK